MQNQPEQDLITLYEVQDVPEGCLFTGNRVILPAASPIFALPQFQHALVEGRAAIRAELYQQLKQVVEDLG